MRRFALLLLLPAFAWAAPHNTVVTTPLTTPTDSHIFCPFLKAAIPDITLTEEDALPTILFRNHIAIGDDRWTSSPIGALDLAPTIADGGNPITGGSLTTNDPNYNFAYYSGTTTTSSAGTGTITFTGDNAATGCGTVVESVAWDIADSASPTGDIPLADGPGSGNYFVAENGSDSNNGRYPTPQANGNGPWRNISRVNAILTTANNLGNNVYFRSGDTFGASDPTPSKLLVDWSGTSGDHVVIGTYYLVGTAPFELRPDNPTAWPTAYTYSNGARAIILGSCPTLRYDDPLCFADTDNKKPTWGAYDNDVGSIPAKYGQGLIEVGANYVDVQDLKVYGSGGVGVYVLDSGIDGSPWHDHMLKRLWIERAFNHAVRFYVATRSTLRDSVIRHAAINNFPDPGENNQGGMAVQNAHLDTRNDYLIEGNDFAGMSTGIQFFFRVNGLIVRGNRMTDVIANRPCYYGDDGEDHVIEYNTCYGGGYGVDTNNVITRDASAGSRGIVYTYEINPNQGGLNCVGDACLIRKHVPLSNVTIRGNMMTNTKNCIQFQDNSAGVLTPPGVRLHEGRIYNNTCLYASEAPLDMVQEYRVGPGGFDVRNNIFQSESATPCLMYTATANAPAPTIDYNLWSSLPAAACRGAHDPTAAAPVVAGTGMNAKTGASTTAPTDFVLQAGSPGLAAGTPLSLTILDVADFPQYTGVTYPCATFDVKGGLIDAICVTRDASTPDLGAQERP